MAKKSFKRVYEYQCTMTQRKYKTTKEAPNPNDLVSVKAYYELNPELDDRPENIKKEVALQEEAEAQMEAMKMQNSMPDEEFSEDE